MSEPTMPLPENCGKRFSNMGQINPPLVCALPKGHAEERHVAMHAGILHRWAENRCDAEPPTQRSIPAMSEKDIAGRRECARIKKEVQEDQTEPWAAMILDLCDSHESLRAQLNATGRRTAGFLIALKHDEDLAIERFPAFAAEMTALLDELLPRDTRKAVEAALLADRVMLPDKPSNSPSRAGDQTSEGEDAR
jgi:hypothetical protein